MNRSRGLPSIGVPFATLFATACGGGTPLLHPAHVLPASQVSAGAGVSGQFVLGGAEKAIEQGTVAGAPNSSGDPEQAFLAGAIAHSSLAPGIAPWVGARVGVGGNNEGGLTYTGRAARVDARHAFGDEKVALSVGLGASAVLMHPPHRGVATPQDFPTAGRFTGASTNMDATGWGLDVPVVVGMRSEGSILQGWVGIRGGFERIAGKLDLVSNGGTDRADVRATRGYGGGLVGAAIGLRPFWVAIELDVAYQGLSGSASFPANPSVPAGSGGSASSTASASGVTLAPAGAIIGKF